MVSLYGLEGLGFRAWGLVQGLGCRGYGGILELSKLWSFFGFQPLYGFLPLYGAMCRLPNRGSPLRAPHKSGCVCL